MLHFQEKSPLYNVPLLNTHFDQPVQRDTTVLLPGGGQSFDTDNHLCQEMDICESPDSSIDFADFVELLHYTDNAGQVVDAKVRMEFWIL